MRKTKKVKVVQVSIDIPARIFNQIDFEADRIGVTKGELIKFWISRFTDRLAH